MNQTKEATVKTALKLFLQKGFYSVSMKMIATEIGISKPAIYHHFANKDAMVEGVLDYFTEKMEKWSFEYYSDLKDEMEFFERIFRAIPIYKDVETVLLDETVETYPYSYNDLLMILSKYKPEFRDRIAQDQIKARNKITEHIRNSQQTGLIRTDIDANQLAVMISTIIEGAAFVCEADSQLNARTVSEEMLHLIKHLILK
jgi:AcrR family transcriptional regulator